MVQLCIFDPNNSFKALNPGFTITSLIINGKYYSYSYKSPFTNGSLMILGETMSIIIENNERNGLINVKVSNEFEEPQPSNNYILFIKEVSLESIKKVLSEKSKLYPELSILDLIKRRTYISYLEECYIFENRRIFHAIEYQNKEYFAKLMALDNNTLSELCSKFKTNKLEFAYKTIMYDLEKVSNDKNSEKAESLTADILSTDKISTDKIFELKAQIEVLKEVIFDLVKR